MSKNDAPPTVQKSPGILELLSSPWNILCFSFTSFTVTMLYPFTKACYDFTVLKEAEKPEGYEYPKFDDFKLMMIAALTFVMIEQISGHLLFKLFERFCKE